MATNYNKAFNFKNGLQVDVDNFIVNALGLVGIGTTSPTELLDVLGNVKVSGIVTANSIFTKNINITGSSNYSSLNVGITSISSGIITASSGIITYYGDGSKLLNIASSYWTLSSGKIYTDYNVGIATNNPVFSLQVGLNPLVYSTGIGIEPSGNVFSNGIVTAVSFSGSGVNLSSLNASNISSGTISTSRFPSNIGISGTVTASSFIGSGSSITSLNASNISSGNISTSRLPSNIIVSGIVTANTFVGNLTGTASTANSLSSTATISSSQVTTSNLSVGIATVTDSLYVNGFPAKIGVGTNSAPLSDIEVKKTGISSIRVISTNNIAYIGLNNEIVFRTGNSDTYYSYSSSDSLDIIGPSSGNVNSYLDYAGTGINTGAFHWICGKIPYNPIMSLTYDGKLGLGITNPTAKLYVVGSSYFTGISTIDSNLNVSNNLYVRGDILVDGNITGNLGFSTYKLDQNQNFIVGGGSTAGTYNILLGSSSGENNQGSYNNFLGFAAGSLNSNGDDNIAIGRNTKGALSGDGNILLGNGSGFGGGYGMNASSYNNMIGWYVGGDFDQGNSYYNNFIGFKAGGRNANSSHNIFVGSYSGYYNNGEYNIFFGRLSGYNNNGNKNTFIGDLSGYNTVNGNNNIFIGDQTGLQNKNGSYNVFLGNNVDTDSNYQDLSYRILIGVGVGRTFTGPNISKEKQFAIGINSTGTNEYWIVGDENLNIGIGTTTPQSRLHVVGGARISGVVTATGGFTSGIGVTNPVSITVVNNQLTFSVVGVGSTTLTLY